MSGELYKNLYDAVKARYTNSISNAAIQEKTNLLWSDLKKTSSDAKELQISTERRIKVPKEETTARKVRFTNFFVQVSMIKSIIFSSDKI